MNTGSHLEGLTSAVLPAGPRSAHTGTWATVLSSPIVVPPHGLYNSARSLSLFIYLFFKSLPFCLFFFYFWDLSFQFNLLISVLISLCRLFADFTRHNFYQLVLKDA